MKVRALTLFTLIYFIFNTGCATVNSPYFYNKVKFKNKNDVIILIYRTWNLWGCFNTTWVDLDDRFVGNLYIDGYFDVHTTPGFHKLVFQNGFSKYVVTFNAKPNTLLIVRFGAGPSVMDEVQVKEEVQLKRYDPRTR